MKRVLITGAAGTIGRTLRQGLQGRVGALRLLDIAPLGAPRPGEELVTADVRDREAVTKAMEGVDATVHLAGIPHEDSFDRILEANIAGTHNVYEAARKQECARVVFASSLHVTGFYDASERISPEMPVRPDSFYGVGKACGENLGRLYADKHGLQVICVRIATFAERPTTPRHLSTWLSPRDAVELFWRCLVAPDIGFTVVYGTSATQRGWWDPGPVERLGYRPVDDAEKWASEVNGTNEDPTESGGSSGRLLRPLRAHAAPAGHSTTQRSVLVEVWTAYGAPAAGSLSNRSISSAACRSWAAWKCA